MLDLLDRSQSFRRHRHDVMNALQLVKAYIQLGKPDAALHAVDDVAEWLHSLSVVQSAAADKPLMWTAAACPRLRLSGPEAAQGLRAAVEWELCACLQWIDDFASEVGLKKLRVTLSRAPAGDVESERVHVEFELPEEFRVSWQTVHSEKQWCYLQVDVATKKVAR